MTANSGAETISGSEIREPKAPRVISTPALTVVYRSVVVLSGVGLSVGLCLGVLLLKDPLFAYITQNDMRPALRRFVLGVGVGSAAVAVFSGLTVAWMSRRRSPFAATIQRFAHRIAPLGVAGLLPALFQWAAWK